MKMPFLAVAAALMMSATTANAGCVTGAVVGGVVGHFAGHHALVGAGAGCVIGHEMKKDHERRRYYRHHHR